MERRKIPYEAAKLAADILANELRHTSCNDEEKVQIQAVSEALDCADAIEIDRW